MAEKRDGWFMRRAMRLTWLEKRSVNSAARAERMAQRTVQAIEERTENTHFRESGTLVESIWESDDENAGTGW